MGGLERGKFMCKTNVKVGRLDPVEFAGTVATRNATLNVDGDPATLNPSTGSSFSRHSLYLTSKDYPAISATLQGIKAGTGANRPWP